MPVGIMVNVLAVAFGGLAGAGIGRFLPERVRSAAPLLFGFCAMGIGIRSIGRIQNLTAVILAVIIGGLIGEWLCLDDRLRRQLSRLMSRLHKPDKPGVDTASGKHGGAAYEREQTLALMIAIFCFSGMGIFGALTEGLTGDGSILLAKSALDFFTAMIFAAHVGPILSAIALPQAAIFGLLFLSAHLLAPVLTDATIGDFIGCGGILTVMVGFHMTKIRELKVINLLPALAVVLLLSTLLASHA